MRTDLKNKRNKQTNKKKKHLAFGNQWQVVWVG